jgi:predicted enzyme related to lactoylglutathione lyase
MAEPVTFPPGAPCWAELFVTDPERVLPFYAGLFGWTWREEGPEFGGYRTLMHGHDAVGGCMRNSGEAGTPDAWFVSLASPDAVATCEAAAAHGGHVAVPAMPVMDLGVMAVLVDPGGAAIGVWQAGTHRGFSVVGTPGAPSWFELRTRDYDASVGFYRDVFGWDAVTADDAPGVRYTTLGAGEDGRAGIMDAAAVMPDTAPAAWIVYWGVADARAAAERAASLGGAVVAPAESTPYGTLATIADPGGVVFRLRDTPTA